MQQGSTPTDASITDKVKTYEDACAVLGKKPLSLANFNHMDEEDRPMAFAHHQIERIAAALNEGWKPDWTNDNEYKYWPWFYMGDGGFSYHGYVSSFARSIVGSRLCFKSRELAKYAGEQFLGIYQQWVKG